MKKKRRKLRKQPLMIITVLLVICITAIIYHLFFKDRDLQVGIGYLKAQEEQDLANIDAQVTENKRAKILQSFENGDRSVFSLFNDSLLIGDSRMYGFDAFGFVEPARVLAGAGYTVLNIDESMINQARALQPDVIYLSFGVNDMGLKVGENEGENGYDSVYEEKIKSLLEVSPNSKIVVNSIIPVTPEVVEKTPRWADTASYNQLIKAMCERNGWIFVDNDGISENGNMSYYGTDGIHFNDSFYPIWAANMVENVL